MNGHYYKKGYYYNIQSDIKQYNQIFIIKAFSCLEYLNLSFIDNRKILFCDFKLKMLRPYSIVKNRNILFL